MTLVVDSAVRRKRRLIEIAPAPPVAPGVTNAEAHREAAFAQVEVLLRHEIEHIRKSSKYTYGMTRHQMVEYVKRIINKIEKLK